MLDSHTSGPPLAEEQMMDWDQFCVVRSLVSDKCREYFRYFSRFIYIIFFDLLLALTGDQGVTI